MQERGGGAGFPPCPRPEQPAKECPWHRGTLPFHASVISRWEQWCFLVTSLREGGGHRGPEQGARSRAQGAGRRAGAFALSQPGGNRPRWLRGQQAESRLPLPLPTPQIVILRSPPLPRSTVPESTADPSALGSAPKSRGITRSLSSSPRPKKLQLCRAESTLQLPAPSLGCEKAPKMGQGPGSTRGGTRLP